MQKAYTVNRRSLRANRPYGWVAFPRSSPWPDSGGAAAVGLSDSRTVEQSDRRRQLAVAEGGKLKADSLLALTFLPSYVLAFSIRAKRGRGDGPSLLGEAILP